MAYSDLAAIHVPADAISPPASWGAAVNDNLAEFWRGLSQPWQIWSPTWSGITAGDGVLEGFWHRVGYLVSVQTVFRLGSTSAVTGSVTVPLPVNASATTRSIGGGMIRPGDGTPPRILSAVLESGSPGQVLLTSVDGALGALTPVTFGVGDRISFRASYETATGPPAGELF